MSASPALLFAAVENRYGRRMALNRLSFSVPRGCCCGWVGANGAGKTTAMAAAAGLVRIQAGQIDLLEEGPFDAACHAGRLTLLPQDALLPAEARPRELLTFYGELQGLARRAAVKTAERLLDAVHLMDRAEAPLRSLSHGMRKRVMIAQCFIGNPELVLLDEPLSGLDPAEVVNMRRFLRAKPAGQTLVISSHNLHEIEACCDEVVFLQGGRCTRQGPLEQITGSQQCLYYAVTWETAPDWDRLASTVPELELQYDPATRWLRCRPKDKPLGGAAINRRLIPMLLDHGVDICAIREGDRLEDAYLASGTEAPRY